MDWKLPPPFAAQQLTLSYQLADKTGTGKYAALYLEPLTVFPAVSCWTLPKSLHAFCEAAEVAANQIVAESVNTAKGSPDAMGTTFEEVFGETRGRRFDALYYALLKFAALPVVRDNLVRLANWYVDAWKPIKKDDWWESRDASIASLRQNLPRLKEAIRDILAAQWLYLASSSVEAPPPPAAPPGGGGGPAAPPGGGGGPAAPPGEGGGPAAPPGEGGAPAAPSSDPDPGPDAVGPENIPPTPGGKKKKGGGTTTPAGLGVLVQKIAFGLGAGELLLLLGAAYLLTRKEKRKRRKRK